MRKCLSVLFLVIILLMFFSNTVYSESFLVKTGSSESTYSGTLYHLELNGLWIPTKTPCIVCAGVAYVPLKEVFQDYLGLSVGYDSQKGIAYVSSDSKKMEFSFSKQEIYQNGVIVDSSLPVASINGNTMVPLSLTAGFFGYTVGVKPDNKTLTVQWSNINESSAIVKDTEVLGTVDKISYYVDEGKEIIFIETQANEITRDFVLKPMEGNQYYRLCVQFKNADVEKTGTMDVYVGSIQQIRFAQFDAGLHIANVVVEVDHLPQYTVNTVQGGIKIAIAANKNKENEPEQEETSEQGQIPKPSPTPTPIPQPTPTPIPQPTPTPIPQPTPTPETIEESGQKQAEQIGNGPLWYTVEGNDCIVWLDGVNLPAMVQQDPDLYQLEYRDIEKMLQIRMPVFGDYKTEVLPGNNLLQGIISFKSNLRKEVNIRISGKNSLNYMVASNGDTGTKIVIKGTGETAESPKVTPTPKQPQRTPTPVPDYPDITPVPTKAPTVTPSPVPSSDSLASRGDGDRSGTVSYVSGSDKIIIDTIALEEYRIFRLGDPQRIVIDLPGNVIDSREFSVPLGRMYTKIRTGQAETTTARIVLEVPENMDWEAQKDGNRLSVTLKPSGIQNIQFESNGTTASLILSEAGIRQKMESEQNKIDTEDDTKSKTFSFILPSGIIDLGNGKMNAGDSIMKAVHTLSGSDKTYLVIEREKTDVIYQIQYTDSNDQVLIVPVANDNSDLISRGNSQTEDNNVPAVPTNEGSGMLVVLDPGHGGYDPGATFGNDEKWYNLDITLRLEKILKSKGVRIQLTRTTDTFVGLDERAEMANNRGADVFISIHNNAFFDKSMNGTMTFYYPTSYKGKEYARIIQNDLLKNLGTKDLGLKSNTFVVLKKTKMPAVLVEIACLSNVEDRAKLDTEQFRQKIAESLAESILKITGTN